LDSFRDYFLWLNGSGQGIHRKLIIAQDGFVEPLVFLVQINWGKKIGTRVFRWFIAVFYVLECSSVHTPWTAEKDDRLIQQWLAFGAWWKFMKKQWEARNANQLKNRWYHVVRPRLHGPGADFTTLTRVLEQGRKELRLPVLTKAENEVRSKLNVKAVVT
jgi:hypothetical protein